MNCILLRIPAALFSGNAADVMPAEEYRTAAFT
jgi:hypothetical protein